MRTKLTAIVMLLALTGSAGTFTNIVLPGDWPATQWWTNPPSYVTGKEGWQAMNENFRRVSNSLAAMPDLGYTNTWTGTNDFPAGKLTIGGVPIGSGGSQTPWTGDVDAGETNSLVNVLAISGMNWSITEGGQFSGSVDGGAGYSAYSLALMDGGQTFTVLDCPNVDLIVRQGIGFKADTLTANSISVNESFSAINVSIEDGGTDYGDSGQYDVIGGTFSSAIKLFLTVEDGIVIDAEIVGGFAGSYSERPTNPVTTSAETSGDTATFTISWTQTGPGFIGNASGLTNATPALFPATNSPSSGDALRWDGENFYWGP